MENDDLDLPSTPFSSPISRSVPTHNIFEISNFQENEIDSMIHIEDSESNSPAQSLFHPVKKKNVEGIVLGKRNRPHESFEVENASNNSLTKFRKKDEKTIVLNSIVPGKSLNLKLEFFKRFFCPWGNHHLHNERGAEIKPQHVSFFGNIPMIHNDVFFKIGSGAKNKFKGMKINRMCLECINKRNSFIVETTIKIGDEALSKSGMLLDQLLKSEKIIMDQNLKIHNLELEVQKKSLQSESMVMEIGDVIFEELSQFASSASKVTTSTLKKFNFAAEKKKKKNLFLSKILNRLVSRRPNVKKENFKKIEIMIDFVLSVALKIVNLNYNSPLNHILALLVGQFARSDTVETLLNHIGVCLSPTTKKSFLERESKKRSKNKLPKKNGFPIVVIFDNVQKVRKRSRQTQDIKSDPGVYTNFGYFRNCSLLLSKIESSLASFSDEDVKKIKFSDVCYNQYEENKFVNWMKIHKHPFLLKELVDESKVFKGGDIVVFFQEKKDSFESKFCCNIEYSIRKKKCEVCKKMLSNANERKIEKNKVLEDLINEKKNLTNVNLDDRLIINKKEAKINEKLNIEIIDKNEKIKNNNSDIIIVKGVSGNPSKLDDVNKLVKYSKKFFKSVGQDVFMFIQDGSPNSLMISQILRKNELYKNVITRNGWFHTFQIYVKIFLKLVLDLNQKIFVSVGYKTQRAQDFIAGAGDMHKALEVIEIIFKSLYKECLSKYVNTNGKTFFSMLNNFDEFWSNLNENKGYLFFLLKFSGCILFMKYGFRVGGEKGVEIVHAMRKILCKYLFLDFHLHYQKIELFEFIQNEIIKSKNLEFYKFLGDISLQINKDKTTFQPSDAVLEQKNRNLISQVGNPTEKNWNQSTILFEDIKVISEIGRDLFQIKDRSRVLKKVSHVLDEVYTREHFRDNFSFYQKFRFASYDSDDEEINGSSVKELDEMLKERQEIVFDKLKTSLSKGMALKLSSDDCWEVKFLGKFKKKKKNSENEDSTFIIDDELFYEDEKKSELSIQNNVSNLIINNNKRGVKEEKIYLKVSDVEKISNPTNNIKCCSCESKIETYKGVGKCDKCLKKVPKVRSFFVNNGKCGKVFNNFKGERIASYCKQCIISSRCSCGSLFNDLNNIDICNDIRCHCLCCKQCGGEREGFGKAFFCIDHSDK